MGRGRGRNLGGENKDHSERKVVKETAGKKDNPTRKEWRVGRMRTREATNFECEPECRDCNCI
jgi:hypothetical protein